MTSSIIKILLLGDYSIFRNALRMLIETEPRLRVIGEADNIESARQIVSVESPDIVLVDLPDLKTENTLSRLQEVGPPVLVLISSYDVDVYKKSLQLGISGLILKEERTETLFKAIDKIYEGELWFDRTMMGETIRDLMEENQKQRDNPQQDPARALTDREREVVKALCAGKNTREIAKELFIAENTVRHHLTAIFSKLETKGRLELVIYAYKNGLAKLPRDNGSKHPGSNGNRSGKDRSRSYSQSLNA